MKSVVIILIFIFLLLPFTSAKDVYLKFYPHFNTQSFNVYKGGYVDIPITVENQDSLSMACKITSSDSSLTQKSTDLLQADYKQDIYFRYTAPNKIKNLQSRSITFTTDCTTTAQPYPCATLDFPFITTCYYVSSPNPQSVTISYSLSPQDTQNLAIIDGYTKQLSGGITTTDSTIKTLKDLIDKTPVLLKPSNSIDSYNSYQNNFNTIEGKFNHAIGYLEQETYDYASFYTSSAPDLNTLSDINSNAATLTNQINTNVQEYKEIVSIFNNYVSESGNLIKPYSTKSNSDIIDKYNSLTISTKNKLENYQFASLAEAQNAVEDYKSNYNKFLDQLKARESEALTKGITVLKDELTNLCKNNGICSTQNTINFGISLNLQQLCDGFKAETQETNDYNEKIYTKYQPILVKLSYNTVALSKKDQIVIIQSIIQNVTLESTNIEKDVSDSIKQANHAGKNIDLTNYSLLADQFNNGDLADKNNLLAGQSGFVLFFKRIYYFVFGHSQPITSISNDKSESIVILSEDFSNFFSNSCASFGTIAIGSANAPNIAIVNQQSDIQTQANVPQKTCFDENGQRTTNCCDDDSYRNSADLYPVIFIHGHAAETGQKTVQNSLDTFTQMSNYFAQKGYVVKDILYPEKTTELTKGIWGYCKPVALRITYYDGIISGGSVQYKNSIGDYSPTLSKEIDAVLTATNKDKAIIVSHSMGGVLSRYYIKKSGGQSKISKLITISSPHYGIRDLWAFFSNFVGELESKEMQPNSPFLNALNYPSDSLVDTYSLMGDSETCSGEECDSVLYISEAKLNNGKDFIVFKGSQYEHSSIVKQTDVAQKVLEIVKK